MTEISIPYKYKPRTYQLPLWQAIQRGVKRAVVVAHRRSGKDKTCINIVVSEMLKRIGTYYYIFPEFNQGRRVIWDGMDKNGFPFLGHFPKELMARPPNESQMKIEFSNGSIFQIVGSDRVDAIVGTNPVGVVFSEYALQDPRAWGFLRPILAENKGWAIFIGTPRGENHFYDVFEIGKNSPNWFTQILRASETGAIPKEVLEEERREINRLYGDESLYFQEYEVDFSVPVAGSYYAEHISRAYSEGRVGVVPHNPRYPVHTFWDLGINDTMAVWFLQSIGQKLNFIDFYENSGQGMPHYSQMLQEKKYTYGEHWAPFDIKNRELGTGKTRIATAAELGIRFNVVQKVPIVDGIDAVRSLFNQCWFDADHCRDGINALKSYRKQYDEVRKTYLNKPYHDWSSNAADAFRAFGVAWDEKLFGEPVKKPGDKYFREPRYHMDVNPATV